MREQPGAYQEAKNRIKEARERDEQEQKKLLGHFERQKALIHTGKKLNIFELKRRIETGQSLGLLQQEMREALRDGTLSREAFEVLEHSLKASTTDIHDDMIAHATDIPFSHTALAQWLETKRLGENIWADIAWFLYGFLVQGGAMTVILVWRILYDLIHLPRDIYDIFRDES